MKCPHCKKEFLFGIEFVRISILDDGENVPTLICNHCHVFLGVYYPELLKKIYKIKNDVEENTRALEDMMSNQR